ncbi:MAG TPA: DUF1501 domain-containing protein [Planctomycetota bacterium]|nr:DUF1501 domain-containing protein [Planctomycetota bacterium]
MKGPEMNPCDCASVSRRTFLADTGMGLTGFVLGAMLQRDGLAKDDERKWAPPDGKPHFAPQAKSVIWLFMKGGASHMETFDPKPELNRYGGKKIGETPYKDTYGKGSLRELTKGTLEANTGAVLLPLQVGYRKYGESGIEVSDWWPNVAQCVDDLAVVRSLWTTDIGHTAQLQFHTGRHFLDGVFPTIGSWIHYGLGALNENLPQFVVLGDPVIDAFGGANAHGAHYLGPEHSGVRMNVDPDDPLPFSRPQRPRSREEQEAGLDLLGRLNRLSGVEYPDDPALRARIKSYELAFRMQAAVPELFKFNQENDETRGLYGLDQAPTKTFGMQCLAARRMVERGVRFIQIYHGGGGNGAWDAHGQLRQGHSSVCAQVDRPIAGLLQDLKRRGLLDQTLVVFATEFGRSPGGKAGSDGREHHPYGFSAWLAGGGIKRGVVHGATDEIGFHAVEHRHYVTDLHATVFHQLGLDARRLEVPGRKRLEVDYGAPIREIIA